MGGELQIPWSEILYSKRDVPPPQLVISDKGGGEGRRTLSSDPLSSEKEEEKFPVEGFSEHELMKKISRCKSDLKIFRSSLPDKGAKLNRRVWLLEEELDRREREREREKKDDTALERVTTDGWPQSGLSSGDQGLQNHQTSASSFDHNGSSQHSFSFLFTNKLDAKADSSYAAFSTELDTMNRKNKRPRQTVIQNHKFGFCGRMPSRSSPFSCPIGTIKNKKQRLSAFDSKYNTSWSCPSFRKKLWDDEVSDLDSDECHEVVLLDEEDVALNEEDFQSRQPTQVDLQSTQPIQLDFNEQKEVTIYYPSRNHPECVEICYSDIKCLDPRSYLSSTIMNFYIQYLQKPTFPIGRSKGEYHFFNTYFYSKLEEAVSSKADKNACFAKLRRWLKGVNIFQKAYVFLPIHGKLHWSLVIICIPAKEEQSGPVILHLDSLGVHDTKMIFENIKRYLIEEWNHLRQDASSLSNFPISEIIWKWLPQRVVKKKIMVPQQTNEYDCGLFVLYFIERFIEDAPERVRIEDLDKFGTKWFRSEEASALRTRLHDLLMEELESERICDNDYDEDAGSPSSSPDSIEEACEVLQSEKSPDIFQDQILIVED